MLYFISVKKGNFEVRQVSLKPSISWLIRNLNWYKIFLTVEVIIRRDHRGNWEDNDLYRILEFKSLDRF